MTGPDFIGKIAGAMDFGTFGRRAEQATGAQHSGRTSVLPPKNTLLRNLRKKKRQVWAWTVGCWGWCLFAWFQCVRAWAAHHGAQRKDWDDAGDDLGWCTLACPIGVHSLAFTPVAGSLC